MAALLALGLSAALPARGGDFDFSGVSEQEFHTFSRVLGQAIFATPVQPARATGIVGFDVGVAGTLVQVDTHAGYWEHAVTSDVTTGGYLSVPHVVVSKGFGDFTLSGMIAKINDTGVKTWGGAIDVPVIRGTAATPELALRGSFATLSGADVLREKTYGLEAFVSKGFGPLMPYAAYGRMLTDARGTASTTPSTVTLHDRSDVARMTAGLRLSFFLPKIVIEATQAEVRSYSVKISVGF